MSTIFADKFKNTSGGNTVQINQLRGIDTAGSITVQGEGTATTNLQQGLTKSWVNLDKTASGAAARDSFNVSGTTDNATGDFTVTFSNNFSNANYSVASHGCRFHSNEGDFVLANYYSSAYSDGQATSFNRVLSTYASSQNAFDIHVASMQYLGDLA